MTIAFLPVLLALAAVTCGAAYGLSRVGRRDKSLPPGPPTRPLVGNLLDIPQRFAHLKFTEWSKTYGPVISCKLFGSTMVVLNNAESVLELMDKRSASSSERPPSYINGEMIANNNHVLLTTGARATQFRKIYSSSLAQGRVSDYLPLQHAEASASIKNMLDNPDDFYQEIRRLSASLTLAITYGKRAPTFSGKDASGFSVEDFYNLEWDFNFFLEVGAAPPLDLLPVLKYVPSALAPWKASALDIRKRMKHMYQDMLFKEIQMKMNMGQTTGCWMESIIKREEGLNDETKAWIGGAMMEGGSDTTSSILVICVLAAVLHPEKVAKAHAELNSVIGHDRSPTIEDMESLPYCRAFLLEVMRWRPSGPAGVPHQMSKDEIYNGVLIPAGAVVVENVWAILHDPSKYDNPDDFNPDRFIKHKYGLKAALPEDDRAFRNTFIYGAGRRICLGMHFAENTLKIVLAKLLWAFDFGHKTDPSTGEPFHVPDDNFRPGHITAPDYFKCNITPRNQAVKHAIEEEFKEQSSFLAQYERSIPIS